MSQSYGWPSRDNLATFSESGLLFACLTNCTRKEAELEIAPVSSSLRYIQAAQQEFETKHYDTKLTVSANNQSKITWKPQWDKATLPHVETAQTSIYVPLTLPGRTLVGVKKYLYIVKSTTGFKFKVISYLFDSKSNHADKSFFSNFSGTLLQQELATGEGNHLIYRKGAILPVTDETNRNSVNNATSGNGGPGSNCKQTIECYWQGACNSEGGYNAGLTYTATTSGENSCPGPSENGPGCSRISWMQTGSVATYSCDPNNPSPGNPPTTDPPTEDIPPAYLPDGIYSFFNVGSGLYLSIANNSLQPNALAVQDAGYFSANSQTNQRWRLTYNSTDGTYTIQSVTSGLMLDVQGGNTAPGTNLWQYPANGGLAQKFIIDRTQPVYGETQNFAWNGMYTIATNTAGLYQGLIVQVKDKSPNTGALIVQDNYGDPRYHQYFSYWQIVPR